MVATPSGQPQPAAAQDQPWWLLNGCLSDNTWEVCTDNPTLYRNAGAKLNFSVPIAFGGVRLTSADRHHDLLTAKTLLVRGLSEDGWITSGRNARRFLMDLLNFFRWRNSAGVSHTARLTRNWFEAYVDAMAREGLEGLLRSEENVRRAIDELTATGFEFVSERHWHPEPLYSVRHVVEYAGFQTIHQISLAARQLIYEHAAKLRLPHSHRAGARAVPLAEVRSGSPPAESTSQSAVASRLIIWAQLWRCRDLLSHDALSFSPFHAGSTPYRYAGALSRKQSARYPTPPAEQTCYLIDRALRWVLLFGPALRNVGDSLRRERHAFENVAGGTRRRRSVVRKVLTEIGPTPWDGKIASPFPLSADAYAFTFGEGRAPTVREALLDLLPAACLIVIAAFSARRAGEIESLRKGCIDTNDGDPWLECYIEKSIRGVDRIPVPTAVVKAVEILEWLSEDVEEEPRWLLRFSEFLLGNTGKRDVFSPRIFAALEKFAAYVQVPPLEDGNTWRFTPQQFRRFFAITYFYRYSFKSLDALSSFLKHSSLDVTRGYVTEAVPGAWLRVVDDERIGAKIKEDRAERQRDFADVGLQFREDRLRAAATGNMAVGGLGGLRMMRELEQLIRDARSDLMLNSAAPAEEVALNLAISKLAARSVLDPHPDGHSYCSCKPDQAEVAIAGCARAARAKEGDAAVVRVPDYRFAADVVCGRCPHNAQFDDTSEYWAKLAELPSGGWGGGIVDQRTAERIEVARDILATMQRRPEK